MDEEPDVVARQAPQVFAWVMDTWREALTFESWVGFFRGAYRLDNNPALVRVLEEVWGAWPEEYRWAARLVQYESPRELDVLCHEIGLDAQGRAFWRVVLGEPVREEILKAALSHMMYLHDTTLLPLLLEVRERWKGDELYEHVVWESTLTVLRDNIDPEMLGRLTASGDGSEGGLSIAGAPEGALEMTGED